MLSLNDRNWKAFTFEELFIVNRGKPLYKQYMELGNIPYISASAVNNGMSAYTKSPNRKGNMLSLAYDGSVGATFYQPSSWFASEKIVSIELKDRPFSRELALFFSRVIEHQKTKYNYGYKWSVGIRMMRGKVVIPITEDGTPDYDFMEQYIKEREEKLVEKYKTFISNNYQIGGVLPELNSKEWKVFFITDIFPTIQRGKRLKSADHIDGQTPYVSSSAMNNGVDAFVSNEKSVRRFSNCLSLANSGSVGSSFYEPFEFVASDHITQLKNTNFNAYHYLFIATITSRLSQKYNFNREINDYRISREKILLPITADGTPDYEFMEQYARAVMYQKYTKYLEYKN